VKKKFKKIERKKLLNIELFLLKMIILAIPLFAISEFGMPLLSMILWPVQNFLAWAAYSLLSAAGFHVAWNGVYVVMLSGAELFTIEISADCTAWKSLYALAALVVATPISNSNLAGKAKFLAVWLPVVFVVNFARIASTMAIGLLFGFRYLEVVHTVLWREGLIALIIIIWYLWFRGKI
jgi:exosortase/archaeosortase family protein